MNCSDRKTKTITRTQQVSRTPVDLQLWWSRDFIGRYARPSKRFNFRASAYYMKHCVENERRLSQPRDIAFDQALGLKNLSYPRVYVSEANFIEAARSMGYRVARRGRHTYFNMKSRFKLSAFRDAKNREIVRTLTGK
jgi:hypothetical protein